MAQGIAFAYARVVMDSTPGSRLQASSSSGFRPARRLASAAGALRLVAAVAVLSCPAAPAWAQGAVSPATPAESKAAPPYSPSPEDKAQARKLGVEAFAAVDAKDFVTAEGLFARAIDLYPAPTLRVGRARVLVQLGRLVAASEEYRLVIARTAERSDPTSFAAAQKDAQKDLEALLPRIAHLVIQLGPIAAAVKPPAVVRVDDQDFKNSALGLERPVDPGVHKLTVSSADGALARKEVTLAEGEHAQVRLELPAQASPVQLASAASKTGPKAPNATPEKAPLAPAAAEPSASSFSQGTVIAAVTTGVLALGAIATGIVAFKQRSEFVDKNDGDLPAEDKRELRRKAMTWSTVNTIVTAGAVVGAGVTILVWRLQPETPADPQGAWSFGLGGRF
jgi:hypothetical protein